MRERFPIPRGPALPALWLAAVLWLAACAGAPTTPPSAPPVRTPAPGSPPPYQVNGQWYQPLPSADRFTERGIASWYGKKFHGRPTSSGEPYNMYAISAAHKTLPLGTWVRVHNLDNGRRLDVRVNDRGPFVAGRIIDLSYGAARELGVVAPGTARVEIVALGRRDDGTPGYMPVDVRHGNFTFQVGAFTEPANAYRLRDELAATYRGVHVTPYFHPDHGQLYAVRLGRAATLEEAARYKEELRRSGFAGAFTVAE